MVFYTIGVYNSTEDEFFNKLLKNNIDVFCDIRQRRGVRGSKYSFVNSNRLQKKLESLEIKYAHVVGLAPTTEIRDLQNKADLEKGELKSERRQLGSVFVHAYEAEVLNKFNFEGFFNDLEIAGASRIVLFCVEEYAKACHRSVVASRLTDGYRYTVNNL